MLICSTIRSSLECEEGICENVLTKSSPSLRQHIMDHSHSHFIFAAPGGEAGERCFLDKRQKMVGAILMAREGFEPLFSIEASAVKQRSRFKER